MSIFTKNELEYISEQRLGRLATVDMDGIRTSFQLDFATILKQTRLTLADIMLPRPRSGVMRDDIPEWRL